MSFIFGDKPDAPDPAAVAAQQQQYNIEAAAAQNKGNSYDQTNSFGAIRYVQDPSSPSGYRIDTSLNPQSQALLDTQRGTALNLANNSAGMYSQPFNAGTETAKKLNQWSADYVSPIFKQQDSNLEAQLRDMGLPPGSEAYNNAKNLLSRNQGDFTTNYLKQNQGQAFDQAVTEYGLPIQTIRGLEGTMPGNPQFAATPTSQIQPANYAGLVEKNYEQQMQNYENNVNAVGKLGGAALGAAFAPMTGGASMAGMFATGAGNFIGNAAAPSGGYTGWTRGGGY